MINSNEQNKKSKIATTLLHHSILLREFKKTRAKIIRQELKQFEPAIKDNSPKTLKLENNLTQSEIHLKAVLGKDFQAENISANVNQLLAKIDGSEATQAPGLLRKLSALIANERAMGEKYIFLYHACDSAVAFSYLIYTKIYETLKIKNHWPAFRANFNDFNTANLNQFKHDPLYPSTPDKAPNFYRFGLSVNPFLFGCFDKSGECSVSFFKENWSSVSLFNLKNCLVQLFLPYNIPELIIEKLLAFYPKFQTQHGNALYQIAIPSENIDEFTYPSAAFGVKHPFSSQSGNIAQLSVIIKTLHEEVEQKNLTQATVDYINTLQARLFATPQNKFKVTTMSHYESPSSLLSDLKELLQPALHHLLSNCFNHNFDSSTCLLRILPLIYATNDLDTSVQVSFPELQRRFTGAIKENNLYLAKQLIILDVNLKFASINVKNRDCLKTQFFGGQERESNYYKHPLLYILTFRPNHNFIIDIYSSDELIAFLKTHSTLKIFHRLFKIIAQQNADSLLTDCQEKALFSIHERNNYGIDLLLCYISKNNHSKWLDAQTRAPQIGISKSPW